MQPCTTVSFLFNCKDHVTNTKKDTILWEELGYTFNKLFSEVDEQTSSNNTATHYAPVKQQNCCYLRIME